MPKLVYVVERRPDMPEAEFYDYWLNHHGPLVRSLARTLRARRYVQSHLIETPLNKAIRSVQGLPAPPAGIAEIWWDSLEDFQAVLTTPEGQAVDAALKADEANFVDFGKSHIFLTEEHVIFDHTDKYPLGEHPLKCTYLVTKRDDLTQAAHHGTWLKDHGPLVDIFAEVTKVAKYVRSHTIAPEVNEALMNGRGTLPPLDGITEVSFADPAACQDSEEANKTTAAMVEDEKRFAEMDKSKGFMTKEHVIFDFTRCEAMGIVPISGLE